MFETRMLIAAALTAGVVSAQGFTSPAGYLTTEGSSNHDYILFKYDDMRWQQLDDTSLNQPATNVQRISWRRDGTSGADPAWTARTIDIEVVLSHSVPAGSISERFPANYTGNTATVFASRPVNLPDWTQPPAATPAPWDLVLQLDTPWPYAGTSPYLWEVRVRNNQSASDYGNDFQSISGTTGTSNSGTLLGTGCTATGQTSSMALSSTIKNQVTRFRIAYNLTNGPITQPAYVNLDLSNANLTVPGLCTTVFATPLIPIPLGTTDASGDVQGFSIENIAFNPALVGVQLYSQAIALDPGQPGIPVALSNGRLNTIPSTPANPASVTRGYAYRLSTGSMRSPSVWTGGIVTRLD